MTSLTRQCMRMLAVAAIALTVGDTADAQQVVKIGLLGWWAGGLARLRGTSARGRWGRRVET